MIFKFLNASTFDGYNPYRVTKGGFDWETIERMTLGPTSGTGGSSNHLSAQVLGVYRAIQTGKTTGLL